MNSYNIAQLWAGGETVLRAADATELEIRLVRMAFYQGGYQVMAHYLTMIENGASAQEISAHLLAIMSDCQALFAQERSARPIMPLIAALTQAAEPSPSSKQ